MVQSLMQVLAVMCLMVHWSSRRGERLVLDSMLSSHGGKRLVLDGMLSSHGGERLLLDGMLSSHGRERFVLDGKLSFNHGKLSRSPPRGHFSMMATQ